MSTSSPEKHSSGSDSKGPAKRFGRPYKELTAEESMKREEQRLEWARNHARKKRAAKKLEQEKREAAEKERLDRLERLGKLCTESKVFIIEDADEFGRLCVLLLRAGISITEHNESGLLELKIKKKTSPKPRVVLED